MAAPPARPRSQTFGEQPLGGGETVLCTQPGEREASTGRIVRKRAQRMDTATQILEIHVGTLQGQAGQPPRRRAIEALVPMRAHDQTDVERVNQLHVRQLGRRVADLVQLAEGERSLKAGVRRAFDGHEHMFASASSGPVGPHGPRA